MLVLLFEDSCPIWRRRLLADPRWTRARSRIKRHLVAVKNCQVLLTSFPEDHCRKVKLVFQSRSWWKLRQQLSGNQQPFSVPVWFTTGVDVQATQIRTIWRPNPIGWWSRSARQTSMFRWSLNRINSMTSVPSDFYCECVFREEKPPLKDNALECVVTNKSEAVGNAAAETSQLNNVGLRVSTVACWWCKRSAAVGGGGGGRGGGGAGDGAARPGHPDPGRPGLPEDVGARRGAHPEHLLPEAPAGHGRLVHEGALADGAQVGREQVRLWVVFLVRVDFVVAQEKPGRAVDHVRPRDEAAGAADALPQPGPRAAAVAPRVRPVEQGVQGLPELHHQDQARERAQGVRLPHQ